ncbi:MAG: hypothetical protein RDU76_09120, partial [Candidatus Edwardsbacteria bacterium]|nr:hypothetical protein [Candidatus Edwardsbacteria bacterium]
MKKIPIIISACAIFLLLLSCLVKTEDINGKLNNIILVLTLGIIALYTVETRKMQLGIKKQVELSIKPCLALDFGKNGIGMATTCIDECHNYKFINVGNASAVNIYIEEKQGNTININFGFISRVLRKNEISNNIQLTINGKTSEAFVDEYSISHSTDELLDGIKHNGKLIYETNLNYEDIEGNKYTQKVTIFLKPKMDLN